MKNLPIHLRVNFFTRAYKGRIKRVLYNHGLNLHDPKWQTQAAVPTHLLGLSLITGDFTTLSSEDPNMKQTVLCPLRHNSHFNTTPKH